MSTRKTQIDWLIDYYYDERPEIFGASNTKMEDAFNAHFGFELSDRLWKERVRSAAERMGLIRSKISNMRLGFRPQGEPAFWIVYS